LHDRNGAKVTVSGGPDKNGPLGSVLGLRYLTKFEATFPEPTHFVADYPGQPDSFDISGEGVCIEIDTLQYVYDSFPNHTVRYNIFGPNSNSFTYTLGLLSGFEATPPARAVGWGLDVFNYVQ
jgi:hypothetical protein